MKFEFDSDRLTKPAELILNDVADTLAAYPDVTVEVQGHTDSEGDPGRNQTLSEQRAAAVLGALVGLVIAVKSKAGMQVAVPFGVFLAPAAPQLSAALRQLSLDRGLTLSQNARLFALVFVSAGDASIAGMESKYFHQLWRPITASRA